MALFAPADPYPPPGNSQASMRRDTGAVAAKTSGAEAGEERRRDTWEAREDSGITLNLEKGIGLKFLNRTAVDGNARGVRRRRAGPRKSYFFRLTACPPSKRSAGGRVQRLEEHRDAAVVSGQPGALENRRTEKCRPRLVALITASGLQGKGSRQNGSVTLEKDWLEGGLGTGSQSPNPPGCRWTARSVPAGARAGRRVGPGTDRERPFGAFPRRRTADSELVRTRGMTA
ncbi:hypothetical protein H6P81_021234 [Aristolochia fimbriata]|uniref:Uncharacterized protein n=1 Tax=Aristolochia fimbriata TaxID=158543 RepID=A0AAV7DQK7_ARIFI|nr:hypothetical protein H6P81_021234 [Aristolochia fimbriata]